MKKIRKILEEYRYRPHNKDDCGYWLVNDEDFDNLEQELEAYMEDKIAEVVWEYEVDE